MTLNLSNIGIDGDILSYTPDDISSFYINGLKKQPLNDKIEIPNVNYIFVNYKYYNDFYDALLKSEFTNVKSIGSPIADSTDIIYTKQYLKDSLSITSNGWANNTLKNNGSTYFGYTFEPPITNFIMLDWYEYSDYNVYSDRGNIFKFFSNIDTKSKCIKIKLIYNDDTYSFITYSMLDLKNCKNISINSKNDIIYKENPQSHTIIKLLEPIQKNITSILVYRYDNIKNYWGIITEFNVFIKNVYNLMDNMYFINDNNTEFPISDKVPNNINSFGFYSIPITNQKVLTDADIEKISKSNIITIYNENDIKYNMIML